MTIIIFMLSVSFLLITQAIFLHIQLRQSKNMLNQIIEENRDSVEVLVNITGIN